MTPVKLTLAAALVAASIGAVAWITTSAAIAIINTARGGGL